MKVMKKWGFVLTAILMACCMALAFTGCNDGSKNPPKNPPESDFTLNYNTVDLSLFDTVQLRVKNYTDIVWTSEDSTVASVDESGLVTANGFGSTTIMATRGKESDICTVNVLSEGLVPTLKTNVANNTLSLLKSNGVFDSFELQLGVNYNGVDYSDATYTYTTSQDGVVTVSDQGVITAVDFGSTDLTIQASWRNFDPIYLQQTISISVNHSVSMEISLANDSIYTVSQEIEGTTYSNVTQINAEYLVDGENVSDTAEVEYIVENPELLTISGKTVTAKAFGTTTITAKLTLGEDEYTSLPVEITILRPTKTGEDTVVLSNVESFELSGIEGNVLSYAIGETDLTEKVSSSLGNVGIMVADLEGIRGKNVVEIKTETYVYNFNVMFATHAIATLEELKTYIAGITTDNSADDYAILTSDIDCKGFKFTSTSKEWYKGHFDGQGHAIKNYDADSKGLFGCRLVAGPVIENLALYFYASTPSSVAISEVMWNVGADRVYLRNMYIKVSSEAQIRSIVGRNSTENQCYVIENVILDVSNAVVEYSIDESTLGTASVEQFYAIGKPSTGKNLNDNIEKIGKLSATEKQMYTDYSAEIKAENGFNEYWSVKEDGVYFNGAKVVNNATVETKAIEYKAQSSSLAFADLTDSNTQKVFVNSVEVADFATASLNMADFAFGAYNIIEVTSAEKVERYPFTVVTATISTGSEFKNIIASFYNVTSSAENGSADDYYVLTKDITLPQSGSTAGVWSTNNNWNFEKARFNGLGHTIDCKDVKITGHGIFGDIRFSTIENVAIINVKVNSGCPVIASNAWGGATISNVYVECDYQGGNSVGLLLTGEANVKNCVVKTTNVGEGTNYALSTGCKNAVTNCYAIGSVATTTNLTANDNTVVYESDAKLYEVATTNFTKEKGYNSYWQVKTDGVYFGNALVIAKA
ncbi:MAG: Ig-like domain-containing protein [Clostridia bacterium]|nr:Ig-like domain-containing protein [Clostridia bacterium]